MKKSIIFAGMLALAPTFALAQAAATTTDPETPAVATTDTTNATAPVAGANSFTEAQATERLTEAGYSGISALKLDDQGIWRATATKDSKNVAVALDYQGNIVAQ